MTQSRTLCLNGRQYFHRFKKKEVSPNVNFLAWLDEQDSVPKFYWKGREGKEIAGCGSVLTVHAIPQLDQANDSPARLWGGHAFFRSNVFKDQAWASFPGCAFFLPQYELVRNKNTVELITNAINAPFGEELQVMPRDFSNTTLKLTRTKNSPPPKMWKNLVEEALQQEEIEKIVLARRSTYQCAINPFELLSTKIALKSTCFALQFSENATFIGVTPEKLYQRKERTLFTEALAGTRRRGKTTKEDLKLEQELLQNAKERREFLFVKGAIEQSIRPLCTQFSWEEKDHVIKTPTVQHLYNALEATLDIDTRDEQILLALHPTAAMGGAPQKSAMEYLMTKEPFERGWYASPIGFVSADEAEFAVAIRSALIEKNALHLFAGAGIVEGSEAEKEWEELNHKTSLWVKK